MALQDACVNGARVCEGHRQALRECLAHLCSDSGDAVELRARTESGVNAGDEFGRQGRRVAICHVFPQRSVTAARRSPYGRSFGTSMDVAPAAIARSYVESASLT